MGAKTRRFLVLAAAMTLAAPALTLAHGGAMGFGMSGGMGMGIPVVADDGTVLVIEGGAMGWSWSDAGSALVALDPSGSERWRIALDGVSPMTVVTEGDLVVVATLDHDGMMGNGDSGGGDGHMGGGGSGHGGMGGHGMSVSPQDVPSRGGAALVAIDLATGVERWRFEADGAMVTARLAPGASIVYAVVHASGHGMGLGGSPMGQGDAEGDSSTTLYALDAASGAVLWSRDLAAGGGGMMW